MPTTTDIQLPPSPPQLPSSLCFLLDLGLLLCAEHGCCYTRTTIDRHLTEQHHVKGKAKKEILLWLDLILDRLQGASPTSAVLTSTGSIERLQHGSQPLDGLPTYSGYRCRSSSANELSPAWWDGDCGFLTTSLERLRKHQAKEHGIRGFEKRRRQVAKSISGQQVAEVQVQLPYEEVELQTLWTEKKCISYFIIAQEEKPANSKEVEIEATSLQARFHTAQQRQYDRYEQIEALEHASEATPWLRATGYHSHLAGLPVEQLALSYRLPDADASASEEGEEGKDEDEENRREAVLTLICSSVGRLLRQAHRLLEEDVGREERRLSRLGAKLLNTFRRAEMSQDPIRPLQNEMTKIDYIRTWQKLTCYYVRIGWQRMLCTEDRRQPFYPTEEQYDHFETAWTLAETSIRLRRRQRSSSKESGSGSRSRSRSGTRRRSKRKTCSKEVGAGRDRYGDVELDDAVLRAALSLIQHRLERRSFDSAIVSFAAVLAWDAGQRSWMKVGNYTKYLSQLIYDSQLLVLLHCLQQPAVQSGEEPLTDHLVAVRDRWLLNDTPGPVAELLGTRLLGLEIARNTVNQAQVRWQSDGETIIYADIQLGMDQLRGLIRSQLDMAEAVLLRDLCFGLEDVPNYALAELVDN